MAENRIIRKVYWWVDNLWKRHTWASELWWSKRDTAESYWKIREHSAAKYLSEKVAALSPSTVLEIGCASGPNLWLVSKLLPHSKLYGLDINGKAVEWGNEQFERDGMNVHLFHSRADVPIIKCMYDVVMSKACLCHIGADRIETVVENMLAWSRTNLILIELHDPTATELGTYWRGQWPRDYRKLFSRYVPPENITITKLPAGLWEDKPWGQFGHCIEINWALH